MTVPFSIHSTPEDRAKLRWVIQAAGTGVYASLNVHPLGDSITFTCFDGERLHRWIAPSKITQQKLPLLGIAVRLPRLEKHEAIDLLTFVDAESPVVNGERVVGLAETANCAALAESAVEFRKALLTLTGSASSKKEQRTIILDPHAGTFNMADGSSAAFKVIEKDGADHTTMLNAFYAKQGCPEMKKGPLLIKLTDRTCLLRTNDQVAVLAVVVPAPEEEKKA